LYATKFVQLIVAWNFAPH